MISTPGQVGITIASGAANPVQIDSPQDPMLVLDLNKSCVWPVDG